MLDIVVEFHIFPAGWPISRPGNFLLASSFAQVLATMPDAPLLKPRMKSVSDAEKISFFAHGGVGLAQVGHTISRAWLVKFPVAALARSFPLQKANQGNGNEIFEAGQGRVPPVQFPAVQAFIQISQALTYCLLEKENIGLVHARLVKICNCRKFPAAIEFQLVLANISEQDLAFGDCGQRMTKERAESRIIFSLRYPEN